MLILDARLTLHVPKWIGATLLVMALTADCAVAQQPRTTVRPADHGEALCNPGMGWVFHHFDNSIRGYGPPLGPEYAGEGFPGLSVAYLRLAWSYLEPEEGKFNWSIVDTVAKRYVDHGRKIALRLTCFESETRYGTPRWVKDSGAKGYWWQYGKGPVDNGDDPKTRWEPDYEDPVFLEKLERFLAAAGERYDGNPNVAFVDIGTIGIWGEGNPVSRRYDIAMYKRHIDLHRKYFPKTLLVALDDWHPGPGIPAAQPWQPILDYALQQGLTIRDDSVMWRKGVTFSSDWIAEKFWHDKPVIIESGHYSPEIWGDGETYLDAMEAYHAAYVSIHGDPRVILKNHPDLIRRMNLRMGYRLQLVEASWPREMKAGDPLSWKAAWRNVGVAPLYQGGFPTVTLKRPGGTIVAVLSDETFDLGQLPVGAAGKAPAHRQDVESRLPADVPSGTFDVFISVGERDGTPQVALPLQDDDGHRRYRLGTITLTSP